MEENKAPKPPQIATGQKAEVGLDKKIRDVFAPAGDAKGLGDYLVYDILRPNFQGLMQNLLHSTIDFIFGNGGRRSYSSGSYRYRDEGEPSYRSGRRNYRDSYSRRDDRDRDYERDHRSRRYDDSTVILESWAKADEVRDMMGEWLDKYHKVSISDLNGFVGISDQDYTDSDWGWFDISDARIRTLRDGRAELSLPRPESLRD